jgi:hypothetical protein
VIKITNLPALTWVNGITACINCLVALFIGISFLVKYLKTKKPLQPWVSFFGFTEVSSYSGPVVTFIALIITESNIEPITLYYISYWLIPGQMLSTLWIAFTVFYEDKRNKVMIFYLITAIGYYIAFLAFPTQMYEPAADPATFDANGEILDISFVSFLRWLVVFWILSMVILLSTGFYRLRKKLEKDNPYRKKMGLQSLAWLFFLVGGTIEVIAPVYIAIFGRFAMTIFLVLLYKGFSD